MVSFYHVACVFIGDMLGIRLSQTAGLRRNKSKVSFTWLPHAASVSMYREAAHVNLRSIIWLGVHPPLEACAPIRWRSRLVATDTTRTLVAPQHELRFVSSVPSLSGENFLIETLQPLCFTCCASYPLDTVSLSTFEKHKERRHHLIKFSITCINPRRRSRRRLLLCQTFRWL